MKTYQLNSNEKEGLKKKIASKLSSYEEILFCYIHGSFLDAHYFRDVDLAVYLTEDFKEDFVSCENRLSIKLEQLIGLPVDLRILNEAPLFFSYNITKGEVLFSKDEEKRTSYLEKIWMHYLDMKPIREAYFKELLE